MSNAKQVWKWFGIAVGAIIVLTVASTVLTPLFTAHDVVKKTLDADNVLTNYEMYKDLYNGAKQQVVNIHNAEESMKHIKDTYGEPTTWPKDVRAQYDNYNQTLEGLKMQYNRTVSDYNSNSTKLNRNLFKDKNLPSELPLDYSQLQ